MQTYLDLNLQHTESLQHSEINHHSMGMEGELHHPNMNDAHDAVDDRDYSIQRDNGTTGIKGDYERSSSGALSHKGLFLPPLRVGPSVCHKPCWENTDRVSGGLDRKQPFVNKMQVAALVGAFCFRFQFSLSKRSFSWSLSDTKRLHCIL